ncbi:Uncharacterized protein FWK35_00007922 [Aphis craccivora]|uniref:Uncharacterized protein n=1 Tax=Aphis craccivora TaxID=307492 RepID=A0A6G0YXJ5_APHCR|nr:Uncharacterized protein FWK35_00007922 [Aphis craccivora]
MEIYPTCQQLKNKHNKIRRFYNSRIIYLICLVDVVYFMATLALLNTDHMGIGQNCVTPDWRCPAMLKRDIYYDMHFIKRAWFTKIDSFVCNCSESTLALFVVSTNMNCKINNNALYRPALPIFTIEPFYTKAHNRKPGLYFQFRLASAIKRYFLINPTTNVNVISKSSNSAFWPILGYIWPHNNLVFPIGIYWGNE